MIKQAFYFIIILVKFFNSCKETPKIIGNPNDVSLEKKINKKEYKIPDDLIIDSQEEINIYNDESKEIIITAVDKNADYFYEFWFKDAKEGIKKENYISENLPKTVKAIQSPLVFTKISETRNNFKIDGKLFESEYDIDGKLIRFHLTSVKGEGFSYEIYSEGKKIGTTQKDSWTHEPFYYKNENIGVLFIANGDEGGIWGYSVFMKIDNKFVNLGFVEFSSLVNTPLNKFLELDQKNNYVIFNFLEPEIFYVNKINSSKLILKIDIEKLKLLNSSSDKPSSSD